MPRLPIAQGVYAHIGAIEAKALKEKGIKLVLADLDNTLAAYKSLEPSDRAKAWRDDLKKHGIELFILSNSRKPTRVQEYARRLEVPYLGHAGKPGRKGFLKALEQTGCAPHEAVMVGDQIFTDIMGAGRVGIVPLLVRPIQLAGNPGRYIRYAIELPFRSLSKRRPFI